MDTDNSESGPAAREDIRQATAFLSASVHAEVDNARLGVVRVLGTADGSHVYAGTVVTGPLRAYVATAWGPAGHVTGKKIVSYADEAAAQAALDATLAHQTAQGYELLGTVDADA
jgi:hypothetical protein